jgi:hypothetical protein
MLIRATTIDTERRDRTTSRRQPPPIGASGAARQRIDQAQNDRSALAGGAD